MPTLHVVTHRKWLADDFTTTCRNIEVRHSLGFDLPNLRPGDALWAPMEWAVRARAATTTNLLPLCDPGPQFLTTLPQQRLGRTVTVTPLRNIRAGHGPDIGFYKPANVKVESLPAAWTTREAFNDKAAAAHVPDDTPVMFTDTHLNIVEEHRCFILGGRVVTSSPYLINNVTWHETMTSALTDEAEWFADLVLTDPQTPLNIPRAFVMDVAYTHTGQWVALETNPAWSSAPYGADLTAVAQCLFEANQPDTTWRWQPDPHLRARAQHARPLK